MLDVYTIVNKIVAQYYVLFRLNVQCTVPGFCEKISNSCTWVSKLAAVQCKQDQGRADTAEGSTDTAFTSREQGLRLYTSRAIEHTERNTCES